MGKCFVMLEMGNGLFHKGLTLDDVRRKVTDWEMTFNFRAIHLRTYCMFKLEMAQKIIVFGVVPKTGMDRTLDIR